MLNWRLRLSTRGIGLCAAIAVGLCLASNWASAEETAIDRYVAKPDASYSWKVVKTIPGRGITTFVVDMTSQTWRTEKDVDRPVWQHWLIINKPDGATSDTAFLFIGGGGNGGEAPDKADELTVQIARMSNTIVAELKQVPNQPLIFEGDGKPRKEDDLIAYTWNKVVTTGDETWTARGPMIKSAVRAMDTITAVAATEEAGKLKIDKFVVGGGSKRGWTTWLTGAVDKRVVGILPIVIDCLNIDQSFRHHYAAYGFWAPAVGDYVHHKIMQKMGTPELAGLYKLEDPYSYRDRLTMPKFVINAAGDQFFLPDSSQFYFSDLPGEKLLRYVPNADHSLKNSDALFSVVAFYKMLLENKPLPEYTWTLEGDDSIRVVTKTKPREVRLWQATNPKARDFRMETLGPKYTSSVLNPVEEGVYVGKVSIPNPGWTAFFVELTYDSGSMVPLKVTTQVRVVPDVLPYADKDILPAGK